MNEIWTHLQRTDVRQNLHTIARVKEAARDFLKKRGFQEFDTPVLMPLNGEKYNPTFELTVQGKRVCLADSPQVFKMLLVLAGYEKYYQFAHCFRPIACGENTDMRLNEFMQLDLEMKAKTLEELILFAEALLLHICESLSVRVRIETMDGLVCREKYGPELKPDLRKSEDEISIVFIKHMPLTNGERTTDGGMIPCHHIFAKPSENFTEDSRWKLTEMSTESFDIVMNGTEIGGGDLRIMDRTLLEKMMDLFDVEREKYSGYLEMLGEYQGEQIGGFAIGMERLIMALCGCDTINDTVGFPSVFDW